MMKKTRFDSFEKYLTFYCDNSTENDEESFYENILKKMNKDFGLKLKTVGVEESEKSEDENIYDRIKEIVDGNEIFVRYINRSHFKELKKLFKNNKKNGVYKRSECQLEIMIKNKMEYVVNDFLAFDKFSGMINSLTSSFKIDSKFKSPSAIQKKLVEMKKNGNIVIDPIDSINKFNTYVEKIYSLEEGNKSMIKIKDHYNQIYNYFKYNSAIRFLFVGAHNTGKSSVINNIIGYNLNYLPTNLQECTKVGIIIKYVKNIKEPQMHKAQFITNNKNYNYFKYINSKDEVEIELQKMNIIKEKKVPKYEPLDRRSNKPENKIYRRIIREKIPKKGILYTLSDNESESYKEKMSNGDLNSLNSYFDSQRIMEDFDDDDEYPIKGSYNIRYKLNKLNNLENIKNMKLRFYVIESPKELLDKLEIDEDTKEKIELIDFPGLDTRFNEAQAQSKTLLSVIEGFIHINSKIE